MPRRSHLRLMLLALLVFSCLSSAQGQNNRQGNDSLRNELARGGAAKEDEANCDAAGLSRDQPCGLPRYSSTVSEVRVTFFATEQNNRPVETLSKDDFAVVDNEQVIRNFRSFTHSQETALEVVVLVDMSESVAPRLRSAISNVLQLVALDQSIPSDNTAVLSFGGMVDARPARTREGGKEKTSGDLTPAILCSGGCGGSDSIARLQAVKSGGMTPLYDALIFAADFLSNHRLATGQDNLRPVIILFSDGNDTISLHSAGEALRAMQDAGALIYSVDLSSSNLSSANLSGSVRPSGGAFLQWVSEATGGRYFSPRFFVNGNVASLLSAVLEDLRASYVVTYDLPSHRAGFHDVRLLPTHNLNLTFHSRNGYNYEASGR